MTGSRYVLYEIRYGVLHEVLIQCFAVGAQRNLQFYDGALFGELEAQAVHAADVAFFPIADVERVGGLVRGRPGDVVALRDDGIWIDVEDFLLAEVDEQIAVPDAEEPDAAFFGVVHVPGERRAVVDFDNGELDGFPERFGLRAGCGGDEGQQQGYSDGSE